MQSRITSVQPVKNPGLKKRVSIILHRRETSIGIEKLFCLSDIVSDDRFEQVVERSEILGALRHDSTLSKRGKFVSVMLWAGRHRVAVCSVGKTRRLSFPRFPAQSSLGRRGLGVSLLGWPV